MLNDGHYYACEGLEVEFMEELHPYKKGDRVIVNQLLKWINFSRKVKIIDIESLENRVGKHPFKEFYIHNLNFEEFPSYNMSTRAINFFTSYANWSIFEIDCTLFYPVADTETGDYIWIFPNFSARMKGVKGRQKVRVGSFIRKCFPKMSGVDVESLVKTYKEEFSPIELTLHEGSTGEDFLHAYTHDRIKQRNTIKKPLDASCLKYGKDHWGFPAHPSECYASGDFYILWVEDKGGSIAGRVIVCEHTNNCGPIYSACREADELLNKELEERGLREGSFEGAKLLHLGGDKGIFAPYQDNNEGVNLKGDYLIVSDNPEYENCHNDWMDSTGVTCDYCGDRHSGDDIVYIESLESRVCESCIDAHFFISDHDGVYYESTESVTVNTRYGLEWWAESQAEDYAYYCEYYEEWFTETHDTPEGHVSHKAIDEGKYVISDLDGLAYPIDKMIETDDLGYVCVDDVDLDNYELVNGTYKRKEVA